MNETDILYATDLWVKDKLPSVRSHEAHIVDNHLRIKLVYKHDVRYASIRSEVARAKSILLKLINRIPVSFFIEKEPTPESVFFEKFKNNPAFQNAILTELENYLAPYAYKEYRIRFNITAKMIVKINLKYHPEPRAFKLAFLILREFESGHPAFALFPQIQIDYFCAGTLVSDSLRRKKCRINRTFVFS